MLLHNGNKYVSLPVDHTVYLKETCENLELVIAKIKYKDHNWMICGDQRVVRASWSAGWLGILISFHISSVNGTTEQEAVVENKNTDHKEHLLNLTQEEKQQTQLYHEEKKSV